MSLWYVDIDQIEKSMSNIAACLKGVTVSWSISSWHSPSFCWFCLFTWDPFVNSRLQTCKTQSLGSTLLIVSHLVPGNSRMEGHKQNGHSIALLSLYWKAPSSILPMGFKTWPWRVASITNNVHLLLQLALRGLSIPWKMIQLVMNNGSRQHLPLH